MAEELLAVPRSVVNGLLAYLDDADEELGSIGRKLRQRLRSFALSQPLMGDREKIAVSCIGLVVPAWATDDKISDVTLSPEAGHIIADAILASLPAQGGGQVTLAERIEKHVEPDTNGGCWLWTGQISRDGYGRIKVERKPMEAHRASYAALVGPVPDGMHILHRCDVKPCVNPSHLFAGTHQDNMVDCAQKGRRASTAGKPKRLIAPDLSAAIVASSETYGVRLTSRVFGVPSSTIRRHKKKAALVPEQEAV